MIAPTELRNLEEVVCQRILLREVGGVAHLTRRVMRVNQISFVIVRLRAALVALLC